MADFPSSEPGTPRPLPRRPAPRPSVPTRANRPRFQPLDGLWMLALCLVSLGVSYWLGEVSGRRLGGSLLAAGTAAALYALGWRARDRAAGVSAALLAACSPQFLHLAAYAPQSAAFTLLSVCALLAFVAGSSLAALALAAGAAMVRPDGGLALGLLLLALSVGQRRKRSLLGAALFFMPVAAFETARVVLGYGLPHLPVWGGHWESWRWLYAPASLLLCWLLLPLCGEWTEGPRRARWLPVALWAGLYLTLSSGESAATPSGMLLPLLPLLFALAGGGLSRLLPPLAGESPSPLRRYILATLAVLGLILLHLRLETALR